MQSIETIKSQNNRQKAKSNFEQAKAANTANTTNLVQKSLDRLLRRVSAN